jgi:transposase-like protein
MKTRKKFTREAKIAILRELGNGKSSAQVCRENGIHPSMLSNGNENTKKIQGRHSAAMVISSNQKQN